MREKYSYEFIVISSTILMHSTLSLQALLATVKQKQRRRQTAQMEAEVQPGAPAAPPTRPSNRHKRERDVSHLCPTAVRLARRKEELLRAWRACPAPAPAPARPDSPTPAATADEHAASETDDSRDDEYAVSDEDDYAKIGTDASNDIHKFSNDSSEEDSSKDYDCTKNGNFNTRRHP